MPNRVSMSSGDSKARSHSMKLKNNPIMIKKRDFNQIGSISAKTIACAYSNSHARKNKATETLKQLNHAFLVSHFLYLLGIFIVFLQNCPLGCIHA
jgi:hypothetical protein